MVIVKVRIPVELESLTQAATEELGLGLVTLSYAAVMLEWCFLVVSALRLDSSLLH
jgi:hypothetical protein